MVVIIQVVMVFNIGVSVTHIIMVRDSVRM